MPSSNCIKNLINIKDNNLFLDEFPISDCFIKGVNSKVISGFINYTPGHCPCCGTYKPKLLSKGYSRPSLIPIPNISNMTAYLKLRKKRYSCQECNKSFTVSSSIVNRNCFISNYTKNSIALFLTKITSFKDIAYDHNVSSKTVARSLNSYFKPEKKFIDVLPENPLFDEFISVKNAKGAMSFIFVDADKRKIVDVLENRQLEQLLMYFRRFSHETRVKVKRIVIDMYKPNMFLINKLFPNSLIDFILSNI